MYIKLQSGSLYILTAHHIMIKLRKRKPFHVTRPAMSNPDGLLSQMLCHCLTLSSTLNDILMRAAHWTAYIDLGKLNLA